MRAFLLFIFVFAPYSYSSGLSLEFLDEFIIPADLTIDGNLVGGLSSIEYSNGKYLLICDDSKKPRYYQASIDIIDDKFHSVRFEKSLSLLDTSLHPIGSGKVDPEGLRVVANNNSIVWSSEGGIKHKLAPAIYWQTPAKVSMFNLPSMFDISETTGPRHNAVFEGLSLAHSKEGIWVSMESALKQDGEEATIEHGSVLRISYFGFASNAIESQFAYILQPMIDRPKAKKNAYRTTGLVEILQINQHQFLTMERSYTAGLDDGGNNVSIFLADNKKATNIAAMPSVKNQQYQAASKTMILDLSTIKLQLGSQRIDNLEGMTLGPKLTNGNQSLLMVSDNNFNLYGKQLSQILLFELKVI